MKKLVPFILLLFSISQVDAQKSGSMVRIDGTVSVVRVDDCFESCFRRQIKDNWCWAACAQMVLDYYGLEVSQLRIVRRAYGDEVDVTANGNDIIDAIDGWHVNGATVHASCEGQKSAKILIDAMINGTPLIVGLDERNSSTGHAYVLTHVFFKTDSHGNMSPTRVVVVNPANSNDLEESLDWSNFYDRINTIITVTID